jgi:hypothetical protein
MSYTIAPVSDETLEALSVAELIDYHLERNPDQSFTVFPGEYTGEELSRISFLEFGRACHRFARAIYPNAPFKENEVVGVVVNADSLMWMTALAGIIRAGATVSTIPSKREVSSEQMSFPRPFLYHPEIHQPQYAICLGLSIPIASLSRSRRLSPLWRPSRRRWPRPATLSRSRNSLHFPKSTQISSGKVRTTSSCPFRRLRVRHPRPTLCSTSTLQALLVFPGQYRRRKKCSVR